MAVAFCNLNLLLGLKKPHVSFIKYNYATRSDQGVLFPNASTRSWSFYYSRQEFFFRTHRRQVEIKQKSQSRLIFSKSATQYADNTYGGEKEEEISKVTLIWRAIKLPIYSVALVPLTFLGTGADKNKKESVVNLVGSRSGIFVAAYSSLALGFMGLTWTSLGAGSVQAILLLACAITCGYIYQCPPFRLSYQGLGEPLCFSAFGPFATTAFYLLLGSSSEMTNLPLTGTILSVSLLVGFTTSLILFCSHFHQIEGDIAVGKISPLVRLGTERGSDVVKVAILTLYSLLFAFGLSTALPFTCILLCALTIPMGKLVVTFVEENHKDKGKIFMAKYYCVRLHALFGAALAAGLVAARMIS